MPLICTRASSTQRRWHRLKLSSLNESDRDSLNLKSSWQFPCSAVTVEGPTLTLTVFHKPINLVLPLSIFDIIPHLSHYGDNVWSAAVWGGSDRTTEGERDENDRVSVPASGPFQAGPAKSNELIACRGPVSAAALWSACPAECFLPLVKHNPTVLHGNARNTNTSMKSKLRGFNQ